MVIQNNVITIAPQAVAVGVVAANNEGRGFEMNENK